MADASLSVFNELPIELLDLILGHAASAGNRRKSYLRMMHVCKAFHGQSNNLSDCFPRARRSLGLVFGCA